MKYGVTYGKKIPFRQYHMLEIAVYVEHDDAEISIRDAYSQARVMVNQWIIDELRCLRQELPEQKGRLAPVG